MVCLSVIASKAYISNVSVSHIFNFHVNFFQKQNEKPSTIVLHEHETRVLDEDRKRHLIFEISEAFALS